jgi:cell wall-associated NlpC family hydrolase
MQWQCVVSRTAAHGPPVAAMALFAVVSCASAARAQVRVGAVTIDLPEGGTSTATARSVLTAIGAAERVARERRGGTARSGAARVLPTAERYLGVRYRWGGTSPKTGFDCSGFVRYVFAKHGTRLPRTSRQQASSGERLRPVWSALRPGDLVMFAEPGKRISHVAIYAGRRRIIHATSSGRKVRYDALDTKRGKWFAQRLVAARRVSPNGAALVGDLLSPHSLGALALELDPPDRAPLPN